MATKAKATNATKNAEEAIAAGTEAMKDGFQKASVGYDQVAAASQENLDAVVESLTVSQKGFEAMGTEAQTFTKQAIEDSVTATKAAFGAKSVQELIELNTTYTRSAFDAYVSAATKMTEMFTSVAQEASAPLNARMTATVEAAQTATSN